MYAVRVTVLMGLATRLRLARLLLVVDAREAGGNLSALVVAAFSGGVDIVQLITEGLGRRDALAALEEMRRVAAAGQKLVAVQDDTGLAAAFEADLLVLADNRASALGARASLHPWALIGRSCRSVLLVDEALADPEVDFLILAADPAVVAHAARMAPQGDPESKPWFAGGGVTADRARQLAVAGCRRVAVGRAVTAAGDPGAAASALASELRDVWNTDPAMRTVTSAAFRRVAPRRPLGNDGW